MGGILVGALSLYAIARVSPPAPDPPSEPTRCATIFTPTLELRLGGARIGLRIDEG